MKKIKKLKLNTLSENLLTQKQMNELKGGDWICTCSCLYENQGGSSSGDNSYANYDTADQNRSVGGSNCYGYGCNDDASHCGSFDASKL